MQCNQLFNSRAQNIKAKGTRRAAKNEAGKYVFLNQTAQYLCSALNKYYSSIYLDNDLKKNSENSFNSSISVMKFEAGTRPIGYNPYSSKSGSTEFTECQGLSCRCSKDVIRVRNSDILTT